MILFRNRLIFGIIWKTVKVFLTVIYSILSFFSLQYTLLVGLVGVVLYFTGVFDNNKTVLIVFALILAFTVVYAVIESIKKLLGLDKKIKRSKGVQIMPEGQDGATPPQQQYQPQPQPQTQQPQTYNYQQPIQSEVPRYFRVKQNPSYVMAEYSDRYELFKIENGALKKIRTDYKMRG